MAMEWERTGKEGGEEVVRKRAKEIGDEDVGEDSGINT